MLAGLAEVAGARHVRRAIQVLTARVAQVDLFRRDHATRVGHRMVVDDCAVGASARNRGWWSTIHENNRKLHITGKATKNTAPPHYRHLTKAGRHKVGLLAAKAFELIGGSHLCDAGVPATHSEGQRPHRACTPFFGLPGIKRGL